MATEFYLGLDTPEDAPTATLALVEKAAANPDAEPTYRLRRLERHAYDGAAETAGDDALVARIQNLTAQDPYVGKTILVVNTTSGRGQTLLDRLVEQGLSPVGVALAGGDAATQSATGLVPTGDDETEDVSGFTVAEDAVVETLQALFRGGRFRLDHDETEEASQLAQGLQSARVRATMSEQEGEARPPRDLAHPDLVLSTALGCWFAEQRTFDVAERRKQVAASLDRKP